LLFCPKLKKILRFHRRLKIRLILNSDSRLRRHRRQKTHRRLRRLRLLNNLMKMFADNFVMQ
jgi:hypothetical protein